MGTARRMKGAALAGATRVVHMSSVAVYGDVPGVLDEEVPTAPPLKEADSYGGSKRDGEEVARGFHGRKGLEVTVLRPPAIFGERDRALTSRLAALPKGRLVLLLGGAHELGPRPIFLPTPAGLLRVAGRVGEALGVGVPGSRELSLSRTLRLATVDNPHRSTRAFAVLG